MSPLWEKRLPRISIMLYIFGDSTQKHFQISPMQIRLGWGNPCVDLWHIKLHIQGKNPNVNLSVMDPLVHTVGFAISKSNTCEHTLIVPTCRSLLRSRIVLFFTNDKCMQWKQHTFQRNSKWTCPCTSSVFLISSVVPIKRGTAKKKKGLHENDRGAKGKYIFWLERGPGNEVGGNKIFSF